MTTVDATKTIIELLYIHLTSCDLSYKNNFHVSHWDILEVLYKYSSIRLSLCTSPPVDI